MTNTKRDTSSKAKGRKATTAPRCACGCGKPTARTFAQGHDSKAKSLLMQVERGELKASAIPRSLRTAELRKGSEIAQLLRKVGA